MDTARKFLQMGRTRSLRYALRRGGKKYDHTPNGEREEIPRTGEVYDEEKLRGAGVFEGFLGRVWEDAVYLGNWEEWRGKQGNGSGTGGQGSMGKRRARAEGGREAGQAEGMGKRGEGKVKLEDGKEEASEKGGVDEDREEDSTPTSLGRRTGKRRRVGLREPMDREVKQEKTVDGAAKQDLAPNSRPRAKAKTKGADGPLEPLAARSPMKLDRL